jgi:hypothetical protein
VSRPQSASSAAEVLAYLREDHPDASELAGWVRARLLETEPDFVERVYRGWKGIGYRHPEAGYVCAIYPKGDHVELLFEHGASLTDRGRMLEGEGTQTRFLAVTAADERTAATIHELVEQAVAERLLAR